MQIANSSYAISNKETRKIRYFSRKNILFIRDNILQLLFHMLILDMNFIRRLLSFNGFYKITLINNTIFTIKLIVHTRHCYCDSLTIRMIHIIIYENNGNLFYGFINIKFGF